MGGKMRELTGKAAFVTGGASGIGLALGHALAAAGMKVMLADVDAPSLASAVQSLKDIGPDVRSVACDVSDPRSVDHAANIAFEAFGKVHLLCNNAGVISAGGIENISLEEWRWLIDVNVMGVLHGIRAFLPHIRSHGEGGHILNTASMAGMRNGLGLSPYSATKFAVVSISEGLAAELKPLGIGVSVLCPGFVRTRIMESQRNRHTSHGSQSISNAESSQNATIAKLIGLVNAGTEPADIATRAVAAIQNDELYVFTHPERRPDLQARFSAILAAFDGTPTEQAVIPR
jgi:NAD(P)-dependent dehydrogenase (short-subunit alcohol dehydrogenase family)